MEQVSECWVQVDTWKSRIGACWIEREGRQWVRFFNQANHATERTWVSEFTLDLPKCHMDRPYSGWVSAYPFRGSKALAIGAMALLEAGHCLGFSVQRFAAKALPPREEWLLDLESIEMESVDSYVLARKGTLEDYLPFKEMSSLMEQVTFHYPKAEFVHLWNQKGPELEMGWNHLPISTWLQLALNASAREPGGDPFLELMTEFIEGASLERLIQSEPVNS